MLSDAVMKVKYKTENLSEGQCKQTPARLAQAEFDWFSDKGGYAEAVLFNIIFITSS